MIFLSNVVILLAGVQTHFCGMISHQSPVSITGRPEADAIDFWVQLVFSIFKMYFKVLIYLFI